MFIKTKKGKIIHLSKNDFPDEKSFYKNLWKNKYNIIINENIKKKQLIVDYITGKNNFI